MTLIDGDTTRYDEDRKPNLSWDWYDHGLHDGDLIQGPYFPQIYPSLNSTETQAREQRTIGYFTASWTSTWPFIRSALAGLGSTRISDCKFTVDPTDFND